MADVDDFDAFYRGTSSRLARYAYGLTGDATETQDVVQEAYARAWQHWRTVRRHDQPEAWLRLVVTRLATDQWRRLRIRRLAHGAQRPPEPVEPPSENFVLLATALRALPVPQRRALALHYLLDRPVADIALETGSNINTVKSWLSRGRAELAAVLRPAPDPTATGETTNPRLGAYDER